MHPIVDFVLDGELFTSRNWTIIPRVGEIVLFKNGEIWAEVRQVVWGDDSGVDRQWVQVVCKTVNF